MSDKIRLRYLIALIIKYLQYTVGAYGKVYKCIYGSEVVTLKQMANRPRSIEKGVSQSAYREVMAL